MSVKTTSPNHVLYLSEKSSLGLHAISNQHKNALDRAKGFAPETRRARRESQAAAAVALPDGTPPL